MWILAPVPHFVAVALIFNLFIYLLSSCCIHYQLTNLFT